MSRYWEGVVGSWEKREGGDERSHTDVTNYGKAYGQFVLVFFGQDGRHDIIYYYQARVRRGGGL